MLAPERHRKILELVNARGTVRTIEVADTLRVTDETVRRDFEKLESEGHLTRTHGGAVRTEANRRDLPFTSRETMNVAAKEAIALTALRHIVAGETILLDASSTTLEFARKLPDIPLTVLTNSLKVAIELVGRTSVQVVMIGGAVNARSLSCIGPFSENELECYHVQRAFLSCRGLDADRGLSESNAEQAALKRRMIALADRAYLLADRTKLGLKSTFFFARPHDIDVLITENRPKPAFAKALKAAGVEIEVG